MTPETLLGLRASASRTGVTVLSALVLRGSPLLDAVAEGCPHDETWFASPALRRRPGVPYRYVPPRWSTAPAWITARRQPLSRVRVTPPDRHSYRSPGPSLSVTPAAVRQARATVADTDPQPPRTGPCASSATRGGDARIGQRLSGPASLTGADVDRVAAEHGAADRRGASVGQRAERLLAVATPRDLDGPVCAVETGRAAR